VTYDGEDVRCFECNVVQLLSALLARGVAGHDVGGDAFEFFEGEGYMALIYYVNPMIMVARPSDIHSPR
jgi:hypothetical protein